MTAQGFDAALIVKDIQSSNTDFDTSPQALITLKNAGVDKSVLEAMLAAQSAKPSGNVEAVRGGTPADASQPTCSANNGCLLKEGVQVSLKFAADLNSKTAHEGDPVEFLLDDDFTVGSFDHRSERRARRSHRHRRQKGRHDGKTRRTQRSNAIFGLRQQPRTDSRHERTRRRQQNRSDRGVDSPVRSDRPHQTRQEFDIPAGTRSQPT